MTITTGALVGGGTTGGARGAAAAQGVRVEAQGTASPGRSFDALFGDSLSERPDAGVRAQAEQRREENKQAGDEQAAEEQLREAASASEQALLALGARASRVRADGIGAQLAGAAGVDLAGASVGELATEGEETAASKVLRGKGPGDDELPGQARERSIRSEGPGGAARGRSGDAAERASGAARDAHQTDRPGTRGSSGTAPDSAAGEQSGAARFDGAAAGAAHGEAKSLGASDLAARGLGTITAGGASGVSALGGASTGANGGATGSLGGVAPAGGREAGPLGAGKRGQAASPRGAERANVYAQVERGLAQLLKSEGGTTTLRLTPHTLGSVRVELSVRGGEASATIVPSSDVARSLLEGSLDELRSALEARGVRVARLEVAPVAQNMPAEAGRGAEQPRDGAGGDPRGDAGAEDRPGQRGMSGDGRSGDGGTPRHGRMTGTPRSGEDPGQATPTAEPAGTSAERGAWWVGLDAVA